VSASDDSTNPATAGSKRGADEKIDDHNQKQPKLETAKAKEPEPSQAAGGNLKETSSSASESSSPNKRPAAAAASKASETDKAKNPPADKNAKVEVL
jgi:hypothetical protein